MSRVDLIATVRRLRLEAAESRRDVDVHIAEGLRELGWTKGGDMADEADIAAQRQQVDIEKALAQRERYAGESATECEECGEQIPEGRREAVPGCTRCTECEEAIRGMTR